MICLRGAAHTIEAMRAAGVAVRRSAQRVPAGRDHARATQTWDDVLDYCRRSANPVGRLVLRVAGVATAAELDAASDAVCTALQLTNFWQDLGRRLGERQRLYVPSRT